MALRAKLTTLDDLSSEAKTSKKTSKREVSEEDKAKRAERVKLAKDALERSNGLKGEHVSGARAALRQFLRELNSPKQPSDEQFSALLEGPFNPPGGNKKR